jgi:ABC-type nitrate/sulfonate/bicarbonate transport system substrate-binding protein
VFGGGRTSQAMTAGAVDISVQSGTEMAFLAKGVPGKAVAALAGLPNELVLVVRPDLPIRAASDFKGRSIAVTGPSLTSWRVQALSRQQGFGPNGIKMSYGAACVLVGADEDQGDRRHGGRPRYGAAGGAQWR